MIDHQHRKLVDSMLLSVTNIGHQHQSPKSVHESQEKYYLLILLLSHCGSTEVYTVYYLHGKDYNATLNKL